MTHIDSFFKEIERELKAIKKENKSHYKLENHYIFDHTTKLCTPFRVKARAYDRNRANMSFLIEVLTTDGHIVEVLVRNDLLISAPPKALGEMGNRGWIVFGEKKVVAELISLWPVKEHHKIATTLGWNNEDYFALTNGQVLKAPGFTSEVVLESQTTNKTKGTLEGWRRKIGQKAQGNPYLMFACSAALTGPLLPFTPTVKSFAVHFYHHTSTGKSTLLRVAEGLWPRPENPNLKTWRATGNALEGWLVKANNTVLCVDELPKEQAKRAFADDIYMFGNEKGKGRADKDGTTKTTNNWQVILLSAGELSGAQMLKASGEKNSGGQEVRWLDIPVNAPHGVFHELHGAAHGRSFVDALSQQSNEEFGNVGPTFVKGLMNYPFLRAGIEAALEGYFLKLNQALNISEALQGEIPRIIRQFALIVLAGEYASYMGITGWQRGDALEAVKHVARQWYDAQDRSISATLRIHLDEISKYLSRLSPDQKCSRKAGKNHLNPAVVKVWYTDKVYDFTKDALDEMSNGSTVEWAKFLDSQNILIRAKSGSLQNRLSFGPRNWVYRISRSAIDR